MWIDTVRGRFAAWTDRSTNRKIFGAALVVGIFTSIAGLGSMARELVVASAFGTSDALDAFLIAYVISSFAINVLAGSYGPAVIPTLIYVREYQSEDQAQRLLSSVMAASVLFLLFASVLLALASPFILQLLASGFSPEKLALTHSLFLMLLPSLLISGMSKVWAAVLNAGGQFARVAASPIITPLITVVCLLWMGTAWGIYALAFGALLGSLLEAAFVVQGLRQLGISAAPCWQGSSTAFRKVLKQYRPMVAGAFVMAGTELVDRSMAAMLGPGSVSALSYGNRVVALILAVGGTALGSAVLPHYSRMVAMDDWTAVINTLKTYARWIVLGSIPITILLFYFSEPVVRLLFERGEFTAADTVLVGQVQAAYLLQIPFYLLGPLGVRLLSALAKNEVLLTIAIVNLAANVIGNYILMRYLGVVGISLATSIVYAISVLMIYTSVYRELKVRTHGFLQGLRKV